MKPRPTNGGRRPVSHGCQMLSHHSGTFEDLCFTSFHEKFHKYPDHGHNTSFLFWSEIFQQIGDLHFSVIGNSTNGRSQCTTDWGRWLEQPHWKIRNGDESVSGGTGPWTSISFPPRRFQLFGDVWSLCWHFSRSCITFNFPSFQFLNKHIFGNMMMFWFLFDRHFHTKKLLLWWMILSQFTGSLSSPMTSSS